MASPLTSLKTKVSDFFFAKEIPYGLAIVRILLPLVLAAVMLQRWPHSREIYSTDGAPAQLSVGYGYGNMMPEFSGGVVVALHTALIFFLLTSAIGWCTRFSLGVSTVLYFYFNMLDYTSSMTKYSVIATHGLMILSLSPCGFLWSLDNKIKKARAGNDPEALTLYHSAWPRRMMQLMLGFVYIGAAITKLHTPTFFSGVQLKYWLLTEVNHNQPVGDFLSMFPASLSLMGYATLVWEMSFIFLAWKGVSRYIMLFMGVMFHLGTTIMLGLYFFPLVCISLYFCFFNQSDAAKVTTFLQSRRARRGLTAETAQHKPARTLLPGFAQGLNFPSPVVFGFVSACVMLAGVQAERWMDPYGLNRPEGPYALKPIPAEEVQRMMNADGAPMRVQDKFFAFDVGDKLVSGVIANRRSVFRHGETMFAQATLNPPHEDMWVECCMLDPQGREIDRIPTIATREMLRCNFEYNLNEALPPGNYELVLSSTGKEISRRSVTIKPRKGVSGAVLGN